MQSEHRRIKCYYLDFECHDNCPGVQDVNVCNHKKKMSDWANTPIEEQINKVKSTYPSLIEQSVNLAKSAVKVIGNAMKGNPSFVDEETVNHRMEVCNNCPGNFYDKEQQRCTQCGCYMEYKVELSAMSCPKQYWLAVTPDGSNV